mmetsp:Transcript_30061/g.50277  ORF Transcript_30061/g.50277 Transcript_30061/m.50277 type:complete len:222 (+) Transcript_30061:449-1114(+)
MLLLLLPPAPAPPAPLVPEVRLIRTPVAVAVVDSWSFRPLNVIMLLPAPLLLTSPLLSLILLSPPPPLLLLVLVLLLAPTAAAAVGMACGLSQTAAGGRVHLPRGSPCTRQASGTSGSTRVVLTHSSDTREGNRGTPTGTCPSTKALSGFWASFPSISSILSVTALSAAILAPIPSPLILLPLLPPPLVLIEFVPPLSTNMMADSKCWTARRYWPCDAEDI